MTLGEHRIQKKGAIRELGGGGGGCEYGKLG